MAIYLDYAAATPVDDDVIMAMQPYLAEKFYNPSALYRPAADVSRDLNIARSDVAVVLGAKSSEIIFTAGGTEANNLAIHGIMQAYPKANLVISAIEHDSIRRPAQRYNNGIIKVDHCGLVNPADIISAVNKNTVLVTVMYANNEIGSVQSLRKISAELQKIKKDRLESGNDLPLYFHTDAAQAGNFLDMHVHRLGVDLMTINGGKLYGPKQTGVLFIKSGTNLNSIVQGGGQERNLRSGTENVAGAVGFAKALAKATNKRKQEAVRIQTLQKEFIKSLQEQIPQAIINGSLNHRLPNNLHVTFPRVDNERLLIKLDEEGIYAAAGSACSASQEESSHVLQAIGLNEDDIRGSIRFSMGRQTTSAEIKKTVAALRRLIA